MCVCVCVCNIEKERESMNVFLIHWESILWESDENNTISLKESMQAQPFYD